MMYRFFPYIFFLMLSFIMLVSLAVYGYKHMGNLGVKEFVLASIASAWWVFCQAFELMSMTLPVKLFWANIEYFGMLSCFAYFILAVKYSGYERLITKKRIIIILTIFLFFIFLVFTDTKLGLMRKNFRLDTSDFPYTIDKDYGVIFPIYMLFTYSMIVSSIGLLIATIIKKQALYKKQATVLLLALAFAAIPNILYITGLSPVKRFDTGPAFLGFSTLILAFGTFKLKLLNITPIARDLLFEKMNTGVIVVNTSNIVIDINNMALAMFDLKRPQIVGGKLNKNSFFKDNLSDITKDKQTLIKYNEYIYEVKKHSINDKNENKLGFLYIFNDNTQQQKDMKKIVSQEKTLSIMKERERFGRELHDGVGQMFGFINAQSQTVKEYMIQGKYDTAINQLDKLINVSQDAHSGVRNFIMEMKGIKSVNRNFTVALKQFTADFTKHHGVNVKILFDENISDAFPDDYRAPQILRIIQESLNNIRKHAKTKKAKISFIKRENLIEICIIDKGTGFDIEKQNGNNRYGLSIMRERAETIGGNLKIQTCKQKGTIVKLIVAEGYANEDSYS